MPILKDKIDALLKLSLPIDKEQLLSAFLDYVNTLKIGLYPAQEEAILELLNQHNVILNTPTGSGKSLVALAVHFFSAATQKRSFYTCPIKALVNEKFFHLCQVFGSEYVGMQTGDVSINPHAPIICCTAEVLANIALREGHLCPADVVIMDEFHYYSDKERGSAWQIPLLTLSRASFLLMSATLGDTSFFETSLTKLNGRPTVLVKSFERPVPLSFSYVEKNLHETIQNLYEQDKCPIYLVHFTQRAAIESAQNLMSFNFCTRSEKLSIAESLYDMRFDTPFGKDMQRFIKHGVGVHHAGLLPKYRLLNEKLAQKGLLKVICGTDTLGVGVNIPIRTVLLTQLCKFDGEQTTILKVRDFFQLAGRAGRSGFDKQGFVVAQAPEHVIENLKLEALQKQKPGKKIVKKKPPEFGYVHYDKKTFDKLLNGVPEPLSSQLTLEPGMLLHLLQDKTAHGFYGYQRLIKLIEQSHGTPQSKHLLRVQAATFFRSLKQAGIIQIEQDTQGDRHIVVHEDLQGDFSMHHALSLYFIEAVKQLNNEDEDYCLKILSIAESIVENPKAILQKQKDKKISEKINELKAKGVPYEERMQDIEQVNYPQPMAEWLYQTFNQFRTHHPWVRTDTVKPKSIAREIYESYASFNDYVRLYGLQRIEGILLRYLSEIYKIFMQTLPQVLKDERTEDLCTFLFTLVRQVDTSLIDEWQKYRGLYPVVSLPVQSLQTMAAPTLARIDKKAFKRRVMSEIYRFIKNLSLQEYEDASLCLKSRNATFFTPERLKQEMATYFEDYAYILVSQEARTSEYTQIEEQEHHWIVRQTLLDPEKNADWQLVFKAYFESNTNDEPVIELFEIVH